MIAKRSTPKAPKPPTITQLAKSLNMAERDLREMGLRYKEYCTGIKRNG